MSNVKDIREGGPPRSNVISIDEKRKTQKRKDSGKRAVRDEPIERTLLRHNDALQMMASAIDEQQDRLARIEKNFRKLLQELKREARRGPMRVPEEKPETK